MFLWGRSWGSEDRWSPPCWCNTAQFPLWGGGSGKAAMPSSEAMLTLNRCCRCRELRGELAAASKQSKLPFSFQWNFQAGKEREAMGGGVAGHSSGVPAIMEIRWPLEKRGREMQEAPGKAKASGLPGWRDGGGCAWPQILSICLLRLTHSQAVSAP